MKRSLVLAFAMALGVTASAYAANPFSDVPAGHWAYDSIDKLAAAGVIDGMGDGTFQGSRNMTRYEMAQIVAKAMARGANVEKLAAEFAEELDNLGVRVAALEKKSDKVKLSGEIRTHYKKMQAHKSRDISGYEAVIRSRIFLEGQVSEDWSYQAMVQNEQDLGPGAKNVGEEGSSFKRAFVEGRVGGLNVRVGRQDYGFGDSYILDDDWSSDALAVSYGKKLKLEGVVGQLSDSDAKEDGAKYMGAKLEWAPTDNFALKTEYAKFKSVYGVSGGENKIWDIGLTYGLGDFELSGLYIKGKANEKLGMADEDKGWVVGLAYKGAEPEEAGSWGLSANYFKQGRQTFIAHSLDGTTGFESDNGFKGYSVGGDITLAKNMVLTVKYFDTEDYSVSREKDHVLWTDLTVFF